VRQHVHADAELADLFRLLEYLGLYPSLMKAKGRGQPADTAPGNHDLPSTIHRTDSVQISPAGSTSNSPDHKDSVA
jgi:hypothetical protein